MDKGLTRGGYEYSDSEIHKQTSRDGSLSLSCWPGLLVKIRVVQKPNRNPTPVNTRVCSNVSFITKGFDRKANTTRTVGQWGILKRKAPTSHLPGQGWASNPSYLHHFLLTNFPWQELPVLWKYYGHKAFLARDFEV